jgi:phage shock protein PspC (stress-responsive transcriptional regulator)
MGHLNKSSTDKMVFGVCGGLANWTGIDSSIIRLGFILGSIFTGSILFWIYILLGILLSYDDTK